MRILGIDPGYATTGFGILEAGCGSVQLLNYGTITTPTTLTFPERLLFEYTPNQVKQAVVGYGGADKHQVMEMTRRILKMEKVARPDDAADAIAIALCHARSSTSLLAQKGYR